jgi:DNA mismatch repair protein MLH3
VERILAELCRGFMRDSMEVTVLTRTTPMIVLTREEARMLDLPGIKEIFHRWGIHLEMDGGDGDYIQAEVGAVPTILSSRLGRQDASEMTRLVKLYLPIVTASIGELQVSLGEINRDAGDAAWQRMMRWMPQEMLELVRSKACRGECPRSLQVGL